MSSTISKIAEDLRLSHTTVSRVLNGKADNMISKRTQERVLNAAHAAGYLPNLAARSLRNARTQMVAIFGAPATGIWSGIAPQIVQGAVGTLHARKYDSFFGFSYSEEEAVLGTLPNWRFDGALVLEAPTTRTLDFLQRSGIPWVTVNEIGNGMTDAILVDEKEGMELALQHLTNLGHSRIGFAGPAEDWHFAHYSIVERHQHFREGIARRELPDLAMKQVVKAPRDRRSFLTEQVHEKGVTAIVAYDHIVALDIYSAASRLGLQIPRDFSIVSFNQDATCSRMYPTLTVVAPRGREMGMLAAERLLNRIESGTDPAADDVRVVPEFIPGESTGAISVATR